MSTEVVPSPVMMSRWWRIAGGLFMNLALGTLYAWSVFVAPLEQRFAWNRSQTSRVFTIAALVFALSFIVSGRLQDRFGPFWISITGGLLVSLGFFMCSYTQTLGWLYFWFGVVGGLGNGFGYATPIPVIAKWFPDHRGLALGLALAGYTAGSAIFGLLCSGYLIPSFGLDTTFRILGGIFLLMTMIGAFLLQNPPVGFLPAGWSPTATKTRAVSTSYQFTPGEVLRTRTFYLMWIAYALGASSVLMVASQLELFAKHRGISAAAAGSAVIMGAAGSVAGRPFSGWISDALGRLNVLCMAIGISIVAMPLLYLASGNVAGLFVMVFIVYGCFGSQASVNASAATDFWGTRDAGLNYAMLFTAVGVAGGIGPRIASALFDKYHNDQAVFCMAGALAAIALASELFARQSVVPTD
jgi:OFA family oxalate/formate antiporter-like MFS transporter